jgi:hypothetical protein
MRCDKVCVRQKGCIDVGLFRSVARARLASQVIRRLRRGGVAEAGYDARTFSVRYRPIGHDGPAVMRLDNLLGELTGSRRDRQALVARFVDGFLRLPELPATWDEACPLLRPVLRGATPLADEGLRQPIRRPALPYLSELVVVDQPDTMTYVAADLLAGWGVSEEQVFEAARSNLSVTVREPLPQRPAVLTFIDDGDAYWTSHLLLDGWLAGLADRVDGRPVAFAPERGTLVVTADGDALPALFALVEKQYLNSPRAITPMAYVSDPRGRTVPYPAPAGHRLQHVVGRAAGLLATREYTQQSRLLAARTPAPVPLRLIGSPAAGWRTRAVWERDEPALVPSADEVQCGDVVLPWTAVAPQLSRVGSVDPPRWRGDAWPVAP